MEKADSKNPENLKKLKKKLKSGTDLRPRTSNLTGYKSLEKKLHQIENQRHPIDRSNPFKIYFLCYVWPVISLAKRAIVSQNAHYKLPKKERIASSKARIINGLYGVPIPGWMKRREEPPEVEDPHSEIEYTRELKMSILTAFFSRYAWKTTYITLLYLLIQIQRFITIYATKEVLEIIEDQLNEYGHLVDKDPILFWFAIIWLGNVFQEATSNFVWADRCRLTIRLTGALYSIVYEKLLRIGVVNYHEHDEGSIINYLQNDINKFEDATWAVKHMIQSSMSLVLTIIMGVVFFKSTFLVFGYRDLDSGLDQLNCHKEVVRG